MIVQPIHLSRNQYLNLDNLMQRRSEVMLHQPMSVQLQQSSWQSCIRWLTISSLNAVNTVIETSGQGVLIMLIINIEEYPV
jgi:hypothetical protein